MARLPRDRGAATGPADGDTAQALWRRHRPDVIVMDLHLPGIDGVALTQRLKSLPHLAGVPIGMMSGDACKAALLSNREAGTAGFVVEPFTRESLTSKLQAALLR